MRLKYQSFLSKCRFFVLLGVFPTLFAPLPISAANLSDYLENIRYAKDLTLELIYPEIEDENSAEYQQLARKNLAEIRQTIPATEKILWQSSSVDTNNQWLIEKLSELDENLENAPQRTAILFSVYERLEAIEQKVGETENAAGNRSKDEEKIKLSEILRREEYQKPAEKKESFFQKIIRKIKEWLAEFFPRPGLPEESIGGFQSLLYILQFLLYAVVLGLIGFLIYRFLPFLTNRFRVREKKEKSERVVLGERLAANETAQNLFRQAEELAREGNLRGAIRKGYIALLCDLNDRKIIGLANYKTNRDYLRDVRPKPELFAGMNDLTFNFERHWYGFETADESDWEAFKIGYQRVLNL